MNSARLDPNAPIGVFDSGIGGLSVLQALVEQLPLERFIYVADAGHAPYGERDDTHVIARSHVISDWLIQQHQIKALVVACNTATAAAIHLIRNQHPNLPTVGVEPALKSAARITRTGQVGVWATRSTLSSSKFQHLLAQQPPNIEFNLCACDGLAAAIEQLAEHSDTTKVEAIISDLASSKAHFYHQKTPMDTLVLGCTHYPLIRPLIQQKLGQQVHVLDTGLPVAKQTARVLAERHLASSNPPARRLQFISTGALEPVLNAANRWLAVRDFNGGYQAL